MSEPAFPHKCCRVIIPDELKDDPRVYGIEVDCVGLSKRELLAAMAMQGLLAHSCQFQKNTEDEHDVAKRAVLMADALRAELEKKP